MPNPTIPNQRTTRKPTGKPPWPFILLAGAEKTGKTYQLAQFTAVDYLGRKFWFELGEDGEADRYGALPGADFEIVEHDGSYRNVLEGLRWAASQPREGGKPNLIVFDSMTVLWDLLTDEQQALANRRAAAKSKSNKGSFDPDRAYTINSDQWNAAKKRWRDVVDVLKRHDGPAIATTRFEKVMVVDAGGNPTKDKVWKVKAEKNLPYEADVIVEMPEFRMAYVTGARSIPPIPDMAPGDHKHIPDFTIDKLMRMLNVIGEGRTQPRAIVRPNAEAYLAEYDAEEERQTEHEEVTSQRREAAERGELPSEEAVSKAITDAYLNGAPDEKRRALLQVRSSFGASSLEKVNFTTAAGVVDANTAITQALEKVRAMEPGADEKQASGSQANGYAPAPERAVEESQASVEWPETKTAPAASPAQAEPHPAKVAEDARMAKRAAEPTKQELHRREVAKEAAFQAEVANEPLTVWVEQLLIDQKKGQLDEVGYMPLRMYVLERRPAIIDLLRADGRSTLADRYQGEGSKAPINMAWLLAVEETTEAQPEGAGAR